MLLNNKKSFSLLLIVLLSLSIKVQLYAQDHNEKEEHASFPHHRVALIISHTHISKAFQSSTGQSNAVIVPSWGFTYDYWFNHKFALGLHSDMEVATYIIERIDGTELERERPIIVAIVGTFAPWKGLELIAGVGKELEPHEDFWVYRFGVEYEIEIGNRWDIAPGLIFDIKEDLYDSWTLGLGVGKRF